MNSTPTDRLYSLLPAVYRLRDAATGEPLRALLSVIETELCRVEDDIAHLYDNWFIETCAAWVVPYIGDLLDVSDLSADSPLAYGQQERRAYVANTLAYRRRKGTTPVLEQLTRDVTRWRSRTVEFSRLLLTAQNLNHLRPASTTVDLRADSLLQQISTPFEQQAAYTTEIRSGSQGGRYNLPHVGLFIWRLQNYPIERSTARAVAGADAEPTGRYYTFSPIGYDNIPLFNQPQTETNIVNLAQEINLPVPLRCLALSNELKERHRLLLNGQPLEAGRYFDSDPVLQIFVNGQPNPIPVEELLICSLKSTEPALVESEAVEIEPAQAPWQLPPYESEQNENIPLPTKVVAIDPELGRIAFLDTPLPQRVEVSYLYGFSHDIGGGPYPRSEADVALPASVPHGGSAPEVSPWFWQVDSTSADPNPLATAIQAWNQAASTWPLSGSQTSVPLATIHIPAVQVEIERKPSQFTPGILGEGLRVIRQSDRRVIVTAGRAIDAQGRLITLREDLSVNLTQLDTSDYLNESDHSNHSKLLVIGYQSTAQKQSTSARLRSPIQLIPVTAIKGYAPGTFIPLACLTLNDQHQLVHAPDLKVRGQAFQPGIVQGLEIKLQPGTLEAIVTAGMAVNQQGYKLMTIANQALDLMPHQGEERLVIITKDFHSRQSQIQLVDQQDLSGDINQSCVLAKVRIPHVKINSSNITSLNPANSSLHSSEHVTVDSNLTTPETAIVNQIRVSVANANRAIISVSAGTVALNQEQTIALEQECQFDLSRYAARTLKLFISQRTDLGLPLEPVAAKGRSWQQIGIVPLPPDSPEAGVILIKSNSTYSGDLYLTIPATGCLKLIAAGGYRPHVQGNIYVQGTAAADGRPGELLLDGLLIEGHLTVLAGNLKRLQISHCTLVPQMGGLRVKQGKGFSAAAAEDELLLIAFVMYCLSLVWQLISQNLKPIRSAAVHNLDQRSLSQPSLEQNLGRNLVQQSPLELVQFALQQITELIARIWQTVRSWHCLDDTEVETTLLDSNSATSTQRNPDLEIILDRSICGPVYLADTVPKLTIVDSIIDKGQLQAEAEATSGTAIAAPGTSVEIQTSTVLGMSLIRSLEASNSLFIEKVTALRHQVGCMRFSYVPEGSQTPRRYQCQPDMGFKQELDILPEAITAIGSAPQFGINIQPDRTSNPEHGHTSNTITSFLLLGTNGRGVFRCLNHDGLNNQNESRNGEWEEINHNLPDRHITAVLVYRQAGIGLIQSQGTTVTGSIVVENDASNNSTNDHSAKITTRLSQQLRPGDRITVNHQTRIVTQVLNEGEMNIDAPFQLDATENSFQIDTALVGTLGGNLFRSKDGGESWSQIRLAQTASINKLLHCIQPGTGTLSGQGSSITGVGTRFSAELSQGDTIVLVRPEPVTPEPVTPSQLAYRDQMNQASTRQVVALGQLGEGTIFSTGTIVTGSSPRFTTALKSGDTITALNQTRTVVQISSQPHTVEIDAPFSIDLPVATTFRINIDTVLEVNAAFSHESFTSSPFQINRLYAATAGGGVLQANEDSDNWQVINQGLTSLNVMAIAVSPVDGQLFAATVGGGVFRWIRADNRWISFNNSGLTNRNLTALAIDRQGQLFVGTAGGGIFYSPAIEPDWIAINQGLTSLNITTLELDAGESTADQPFLFAGTSDGKLFGLSNIERPWEKLNLDLKGIDINTLNVNSKTKELKELLVGTATGGILRSSDQGKSWYAMNQGLLNVTEKLQIIDRLKPTFTSTAYGEPGYGQLSQSCAQEIRIGAEDGAEMGVFNVLKQPQREANLQASLKDYLRFGLEAGIFYMT